MPQMAPMNWLMIFISILIFMFMISSINYFNFLTIPKKNIYKKKVTNNWKW